MDGSGNVDKVLKNEEIQTLITAAGTGIVTKARDELNYSPYLPLAGLYSLLSDSFGPVP